jgi:hypothetical protein
MIYGFNKQLFHGRIVMAKSKDKRKPPEKKKPQSTMKEKRKLKKEKASKTS